ncbi:MAG: hypothetical protein AB9834_10280 [Lentimicrobium sp.]
MGTRRGMEHGAWSMELERISNFSYVTQFEVEVEVEVEAEADTNVKL